jgi:tetratricopeptide (TPR) repeat protein
MAGNIFINYRREESGHVAGRLHDSLAPKFGRDKLFMDVDNIPVGRDFEEYLNSQVAVCDAMLAVIGPNWLTVKDETGQRRLDNPNDFIVIEIGAALARNIPVVPVLVDEARMPKASELPDSLKLLARRQAVQVRHANFSSDAEALIKRLREALGYASSERRWRVRAAISAAAVAVLLLIGWGGYTLFRNTIERGVQQAEVKREQERKAVEAEAMRKVEEAEQRRLAAEAEQQRVAAAKADQARQAKAAAEAESKRKADEAEAKRKTAEAEEKLKAEAERQRKEGEAAGKAGDHDRAIANFNEAIRLNPNDAAPYYVRGFAYSRKGDYDRAMADYNEAIRLNPMHAAAFNSRGFIYDKKGDYDRAMADYNEAIRINPMFAIAISNRGIEYGRKGDYDRAVSDFNEAIRLDPKYAAAFNGRGFTYMRKGENDRAMADYNEAIRLDPKYAVAFCNRGMLKRKINDSSGNADVEEAKRLDASSCAR